MNISKFSKFKYRNFFQNINCKRLITPYLDSNNNFSIWYKKKELYDLISYYINVKITKSNIICNVLSISGRVIIHITSGKLGLKGKEKSKKFSMISIIKEILYNYDFLKNQPVALKLKGLKYNNKLILKKFNEKFILKALIYENTLPYNGCRPKKFKRK